jgi:hypothetical protein
LSSQTVRRGLKERGLKASVKVKSPCLTPKQKKDHLEFAIAHQNWTVADWERVIWTDESKINRLGSDGRKWVWKRKGEGLSDRTVSGTVKFGGGSIMIWGCMCWEGTGNACKINGKMNTDLYLQILEEDLMQSLEDWGKTPEEVIFQQDNDPKHKAKQSMEWLNNHFPQVMVWPAQSADLNPIEHLWFHLKKKLSTYEEPPKGMLELWERVEKEWAAIDKSVCQNLIASMPRRIEAVIKARGGYTKY